MQRSAELRGIPVSELKVPLPQDPQEQVKVFREEWVLPLFRTADELVPLQIYGRAVIQGIDMVFLTTLPDKDGLRPLTEHLLAKMNAQWVMTVMEAFTFQADSDTYTQGEGVKKIPETKREVLVMMSYGHGWVQAHQQPFHRLRGETGLPVFDGPIEDLLPKDQNATLHGALVPFDEELEPTAEDKKGTPGH